MATANDKCTASWILLHEAETLITETVQAPGVAKQLLLRWLEAGEVQWRCLGLEGRKHDSDPDIGSTGFWKDPQPGSHVPWLEIFWSESWARRNGQYGYAAYRIEVPQTDLMRLLPGVAKPMFSPTKRKKATKDWLVDEVGRRRATGDVPEERHGALTQFTQQLAEQMAESMDVVHAVSARRIEILLRDLGLWPKKPR